MSQKVEVQKIPSSTVTEEQFVGWLNEAEREGFSGEQLDLILDVHHLFTEQIGQLSSEAPSLLKELAAQAEERCLYFQQPLMHRRRAWYKSIPSPLPTPQQTIAGYSVLHPLHQGSLGSKTLVAPHPDGFLCLLKLYTPKEVELDPRAMFRHQERMIQRLNQIPEPRLEEVLDHFLLEDGTYIQVKPFLKCGTLKQWMELNPAREKRIRLLQAVGEVLQILHKHEVAHMDLKPEQVLVLSNPETGEFSDPPDFVLIDYDFSMVDGSLTLSVGSAPYYAPEQFERQAPRGHKAGIRADTYAFSVFVHRLLAETFPFGDGRTEPTLLDEMKSKRIFTSLSIPYKPLRKVLQAGLHPKPAKRPPLQDILDALQDPDLLEQSHLFPTTRPVYQYIPGLGETRSFFDHLSYKGRLIIAGVFVAALSAAGFFLYEHGTLTRLPLSLVGLFVLGCFAFLALLLIHD